MITRRDLLRWAGLGTVNLLGVGCASTTTGAQLLQLETGHIDLEDFPGQAAFILFVSPTELVHVMTSQGQSLGTFKPALTNPVAQQNQVMPWEAPSLKPLLSEVPSPLQPIAQHPLHHLQSQGAPYALDLIVTADFGRSDESLSTVLGGQVELAADFKGTIRDYFIRVSIEKHYLGGCIKRSAWHAGVLVRDLAGNKMLFDLHIASWWEQWRPCFGVYESRRGFCRNVCDQPGWKSLVAVIYAALATVLVAWLAKAIASAIAAAVLGVLIIIPGVPPPP
ncbi:MAG TPA: hypothetical protein VF815_24475 [Myxococcaceae bacterium]|jgi:hypothetical protein